MAIRLHPGSQLLHETGFMLGFLRQGLLLREHGTCKDVNRWYTPPITLETRPLCRRALPHLCSTAQTAEQQSRRCSMPNPAIDTEICDSSRLNI